MTPAGVPRGFGTDLLRSFFVAGGVGHAHQAALRAVEEAPLPMWKGAALAGLGQCRYLLGDDDGAAEALRQAAELGILQPTRRPGPDAHPVSGR
jgi:hypothetical protein